MHSDSTQHAQSVRYWLALGVGCLAAGLGLRALRGQGPLSSYLFHHTAASDSTALAIEWVSGYVLIALSLTTAIRHLWPLAGLISLWVLASAWAWRTDASAYGDLVWGAHGIRYIAPIALMLVCWRPHQTAAVEQLLRIGMAATFAFHGIEALVLLPAFIDYVQSAISVTGLHIGDASASIWLRLIGCWDLLLATAVLYSRWRWPLYAMAGWGLATAGLRLLDGWWYAPETLLRLIHVTPVCAILVLQRLHQATKSTHNKNNYRKDLPDVVPSVS